MGPDFDREFEISRREQDSPFRLAPPEGAATSSSPGATTQSPRELDQRYSLSRKLEGHRRFAVFNADGLGRLQGSEASGLFQPGVLFRGWLLR